MTKRKHQDLPAQDTTGGVRIFTMEAAESSSRVLDRKVLGCLGGGGSCGNSTAWPRTWWPLRKASESLMASVVILKPLLTLHRFPGQNGTTDALLRGRCLWLIWCKHCSDQTFTTPFNIKSWLHTVHNTECILKKKPQYWVTWPYIYNLQPTTSDLSNKICQQPSFPRHPRGQYRDSAMSRCSQFRPEWIKAWGCVTSSCC